MSISLKTFVTIVVAFAMMVVSVSGTSAQAVDLQAQIASLLAQIQALQSQLAASQGSSATVAYNFATDLTIGSKGEQVTSLQSFLESKGQLTMPAGVAKGYFGNLTRAALSAYQASVGISPAVGYFGPKSRAYVNSLAVATTTTTTTTTTTGTTTSTGLTISLASDSPAGTNIPKGANGVTLVKFNVSGSGTLDGITFKRTGLGATADFAASSFYLYDGGTRLTTGRSLNSTSHEVSFTNLNLAISGSKTLSLVANIASGASSGNIDAFQLVSATGTPTPTGALTGNSITIATALVGGIVINDGAAPTNPKIGQTNAKLGEFTIQASSTEDIKINRIAFTEGGSIANSNLTNFKLVQAGNTLATASGIGARELITFELATPFALEKGQQRTFEVYGDLSGATRTSDTIILYIDSSTDVSAIGQTYGYAVTPTISDIDSTGEADTLTVAGGQITISFNGPVTGDIVTRGLDVELYNFTIASQNNVEIRNLRFHATTTGMIAGEGFNDFKVWDTTSNTVLTSAVDVTTSTDQTFTDVLNINAGQSKTYKVTVDVDSDNDDSDSVVVSLLAFQSGDIRNLDNNTNVATTDIVPNSTLTGKTLTVRVPTVDVQLASTPASQTVVRNSANIIPLVGFSFRATNDVIKLSSVKITATSTSGTLTNAEIKSLGLYNGSILVSELQSLDSSALTATFSNLNLIISKGETKILTVKGIISTDATNGDVFAVSTVANATDITVYDKDGNSATITGTNANSGSSIVVTVSDVGSLAVTKASDDTDSEAGIVVAGSEQTLAKFKFEATNEAMTLNKMQLLVVPTNSATATSAASADEVPTVKLYDGTALVGSAPVTGSGDNSGTVYFTGLNLSVAKGSNNAKTLTVKGVMNSVSGGADSGASVYVSVMSTGFEAQGSDLDTTVTAATGNQKVVYQTKPTLASATQPNTGNNSLTSGSAITALRFKVSADSAGSVSWKKAVFQVSMANATMSAASTANVIVRSVSTGNSLTLSTVYSGSTSTAATTATITGSNTGYVGVELSTEEEIAAGVSKEYDLQLTFADISTTDNAGSAVVKLYREENVLANASTYAGIAGAAIDTNMTPSFIWSDRSADSHATSTGDWANGVFVKPGLFQDVLNSLQN